MFALVPALVASDQARMQATIAKSEQLIAVTSEGWSESHGMLALLERAQGGAWHRVASDVPVMLGRNGLAWGLGLHPQRATKREGDGRSPAGLFELDTVYGRDARPPSERFRYQRLSDVMEGIDDAHSRWYNRLVDSTRVAAPDWMHSEKVRAANPMFQWCVTVKHNWEQRPEFGSCIYLHIWKAPGVATAGCTAMDAAALQRLVGWLDARKRPLLLQLPRAEYRALELDTLTPQDG